MVANSFDLDQDRQKRRSWSGSNPFDIWKIIILKKNQQTTTKAWRCRVEEREILATCHTVDQQMPMQTSICTRTCSSKHFLLVCRMQWKFRTKGQAPFQTHSFYLYLLWVPSSQPRLDRGWIFAETVIFVQIWQLWGGVGSPCCFTWAGVVGRYLDIATEIRLSLGVGVRTLYIYKAFIHVCTLFW